MGTGSFPGVKRPGRGADHSPPSKCRGHGRVELYLYSPSGPQWPVLGEPYIYLYRDPLLKPDKKFKIWLKSNNIIRQFTWRPTMLYCCRQHKFAIKEVFVLHWMFLYAESNVWLYDIQLCIVAFPFHQLLCDGSTMLSHMYIAYLVDFSNPLYIQLKQKVKQNVSTAVLFLLYMLQHYIRIFPYDLLPHSIPRT